MVVFNSSEKKRREMTICDSMESKAKWKRQRKVSLSSQSCEPKPMTERFPKCSPPQQPLIKAISNTTTSTQQST